MFVPRKKVGKLFLVQGIAYMYLFNSAGFIEFSGYLIKEFPIFPKGLQLSKVDNVATTN